MINRTNIALGLGVALYFLPHVNNKFIFFPLVIIASFIPDSTTIFERKFIVKSQKKLNFFEKILKTYLTPITASIFFAFFIPLLALPFFLGYSFTLILDAFSKQGIQPFWPLSKQTSSGPISRGGTVDKTLFYTLIVFDIALLIKFIFI